MSAEPHLPAPNMAVYNVLRVRETERRPIRVGIIGAGQLARMLIGMTDLSLYFRFQTAIGRPPRPASHARRRALRRSG